MSCLSRQDKQAQWSPLYDLLTDLGFLNKGKFDELVRTLQKGCIKTAIQMGKYLYDTHYL
jgi:phage major head subunit gpT-like protein